MLNPHLTKLREKKRSEIGKIPRKTKANCLHTCTSLSEKKSSYKDTCSSIELACCSLNFVTIFVRLKTKAMFYHGYDSYLNYAYPYDELKPLSCSGQDTWGR